MSQSDAVYYFKFKEVDRVLKPGSEAIVTFFYLDEDYENSLVSRRDETGAYHMTNRNDWIFSERACGSENWFHPPWAKEPDDAIGLNEKGLAILLESTQLKLSTLFKGNFKEAPSVFFQDVIIFQKHPAA